MIEGVKTKHLKVRPNQRGRVCARAEAGRVAELETRVLVLEDAVAFRDARLEVLERRLGEERPRRPYPLIEQRSFPDVRVTAFRLAA